MVAIFRVRARGLDSNSRIAQFIQMAELPGDKNFLKRRDESSRARPPDGDLELPRSRVPAVQLGGTNGTTGDLKPHILGGGPKRNQRVNVVRTFVACSATNDAAVPGFLIDRLT